MTKLPRSGDDWQLYTCSMKCGGAARALTSALKAAEKAVRASLRKCETKKGAIRALSEAYDTNVWPVMLANASFGAADTEPRGVAKSYLDKVAAECGFYTAYEW